jgi:phosphoribosyl 1,2-cyclic phosphate phosphodiesterase
MHGRLPIVGFRVGRLAYCTDCSGIPPQSYARLEDLDVLVIDALRYRHHPTHLTVDQALRIIEELKPNRAFLIHMSHDIMHADLEAKLPENVTLGYDGLTIDVAD